MSDERKPVDVLAVMDSSERMLRYRSLHVNHVIDVQHLHDAIAACHGDKP